MFSCLTFLIGALVGGAVGPVSQTGVSYTAGQVYRVPDSTSFTCQVRDYAWPTPVRFSVRVRGVTGVSDPNTAAAARRFLHERLIHARQVKLGNVQDHGYFRLTADVRVDGRDLAAEMVKYGLLEPVQGAAPATPAKWPRGGIPDHGEALPAASLVRPPAPTTALSEQALRNRLGATADLSGIRAETTFQEALTLLSEAVEPPLPLLVLWNDLERNALVERHLPIGIGGFGQMRLDRGLELILRAAAPAGTPLLATAEGGVVTISTRHAGLSRPRTGVYEAGDLLAAPSVDRTEEGTGRGGAARR